MHLWCVHACSFGKHLSSICCGGQVDEHEGLGISSQAGLQQVCQPAVAVRHMRFLGPQSGNHITCHHKVIAEG